MIVRQIKRKIRESQQLREDLVATPYGSLVQTYLILNQLHWSDEEFVRRFRKAEFPFIEDKEFMKKTLEAVGLEYINIVNKPVAVCENDLNCIFCPYVTGYDEVVMLPLFKDCHLLRSQELAMANDSFKLINWNDYEEDN